MLPGPLVFVDVDTQRDFLEPTGALPVPGSGAIRANLAALTRFASGHDIPVIATACSHAPDDPEMAQFPPHCLAGTDGQKRVPETDWAGGTVLGPDGEFDGRVVPHLTVEKREFDVFNHPEAGRVVEAYNRASPTFVVYGVATDYCVKAAVLGLLDRGASVALVVDAVRAIDAAGEADALAEFTRRGALLTLTEVVCGADAPTTEDTTRES